MINSSIVFVRRLQRSRCKSDKSRDKCGIETNLTNHGRPIKSELYAEDIQIFRILSSGNSRTFWVESS